MRVFIKRKMKVYIAIVQLSKYASTVKTILAANKDDASHKLDYKYSMTSSYVLLTVPELKRANKKFKLIIRDFSKR